MFECTFNRLKREGRKDELLTIKFPRHCWLILLVKVGSEEGKAFGIGDSRVIRSGEMER
jgi:hypothetical protein